MQESKTWLDQEKDEYVWIWQDLNFLKNREDLFWKAVAGILFIYLLFNALYGYQLYP